MKETDIHKARSLKSSYITRDNSASLKLYNREPCSTIDRYQNGENAYIYSKQQQQQNRDAALKNFVSAWLLTICTCNL
jgi:hypothetical protein